MGDTSIESELILSQSGNVWAIVLDWQGGPITLRCVRSLLKAPLKEIVVVDNGGTKENRTFLEKQLAYCPKTRLVRTGTNLGYAGGMQYGIDIAIESGADFIWLLNNDCEVNSDSLEPLLKEMNLNRRTGACSGLIEHFANGRVFYNGGADIDLVKGKIIPRYPPQVSDLSRYSVDFVAGSAWLLRTQAVVETGGLDCRLFLIGEEPDWCLKAQNLGWQSVVVTPSIVRAGVSSTLIHFELERLFYSLRNMTWIVRRHGKRHERIMHYAFLVFFRLPRMAGKSLLHQDLARLKVILAAVRAGLWGSIVRSSAPYEAKKNRLPSMAFPPSTIQS